MDSSQIPNSQAVAILPSLRSPKDTPSEGVTAVWDKKCVEEADVYRVYVDGRLFIEAYKDEAYIYPKAFSVPIVVKGGFFVSDSAKAYKKKSGPVFAYYIYNWGTDSWELFIFYEERPILDVSRSLNMVELRVADEYYVWFKYEEASSK